MKKNILLILGLLFSIGSYSQSYENRLEPKLIVQQRLISLNGSLRASAGGTSRTIIPVTLPYNTKEWYYSFSTSKAGSGIKNLELMAQFTSLALDPLKLSTIVLSNIKLPKGTSTVGIELLDNTNATAFINKSNSYYHIREGSVSASSQGTVKISQPISGTFTLGIKNPSTLEGVDVTIEVVAIVYDKVYVDKWTAQNLENIEKKCSSLFTSNDSRIGEVCECVTEMISNKYRPSEYSSLSESAKNKMVDDASEKCEITTNNSGLFENDKKIKALFEQVNGQIITKDYEALEVTFMALLKNDYKSSEIYNQLSFTQLCLGKYDAAKSSLQMALGKDAKSISAYLNLGNYYLLTGKYEQAIEIYKDNKNKKLENKRKFKNELSDDLKEFERLRLSNTDFDKVRMELKID